MIGGRCPRLGVETCPPTQPFYFMANSAAEYISWHGWFCLTPKMAAMGALCFSAFPATVGGVVSWSVAKSAGYGTAVARCATVSAHAAWLAALLFTQTYQHFIK